MKNIPSWSKIESINALIWSVLELGGGLQIWINKDKYNFLLEKKNKQKRQKKNSEQKNPE